MMDKAVFAKFVIINVNNAICHLIIVQYAGLIEIAIYLNVHAYLHIMKIQMVFASNVIKTAKSVKI